MHRTPTLLLCASLLSTAPAARAQSLLNGGFEQNTANTCLFNLQNNMFSFAIEDVTSFGTTPNAGGFGEADVLVDGCLAGPYSGTCAVMIACEATTTDQLAFALDQPMQAGVTYRLSLMAMAWTQFSPVPHAVEFGVSTSATSFGTQVGTAMPADMVWTPRDVFFTPAQTSDFLTVRVALDGQNGSVILDDLVLEIASAVPSITGGIAPFLRGTVVEDALYYTGLEGGDLAVLDLSGRQLRGFRVNGPATLPVADLPAGGYLVELRQGGQRGVMRVVKP